jgi:hypothetical protein
VFLEASLSAVPPKTTGTPTLPADRPFCPAVFGLWWTWSPGRTNPIHMGCTVAAASIISSLQLLLTFQVSCHFMSTILVLSFPSIGAVTFEVAWLPTAPTYWLPLFSLPGFGGGGGLPRMS